MTYMTMHGMGSDEPDTPDTPPTRRVYDLSDPLDALRAQYETQLQLLVGLKQTALGENPTLITEDFTYVPRGILTRITGPKGPDALRGWYAVCRLDIQQLEACPPDQEDFQLPDLLRLTQQAGDCLNKLDRFVTVDTPPQEAAYAGKVHKPHPRPPASVM